MKFDILTLFPDAVYGYCSESILGRAQEKNLIKITAHNFRDYSDDKHHKVDDAPYGGGAGMVLRVQPIYDCLKKIGVLSPHARGGVRGGGRRKTKIIIMDPDGKKFDQSMAQKFSKLDRLVLICGRYQGFDERIYKFVDEKVSVGDFVLSGGELPAMAIVEAAARLLPGVLGNQESLNNETFSFGNHGDIFSTVIPVKTGIYNGKKKDSRLRENDKKNNDKKTEPPLYTRPEDFLGFKVPKILLSGDHKKIEEWRRKK